VTRTDERTRYRYYTVDVFTAERFGGNPLAVFPDAVGIPEDRLQAIARELNLSETVFVLPPESPAHTRRIRIFTPGAEIPFSGHPTVGTAVLLVDLGLVPTTQGEAKLLFGEGVGPVPVVVRDGAPRFAQLTTAKLPEQGPAPPSREAVAEVLSLTPADLAPAPDEPETWSCGMHYLYVALRDRAALARARLRADAWDRHFGKDSFAHAVFLFCREPERPGSDVRARMYAPEFGVPEDPATGSAAAALAGYLAARDRGGDGTRRVVIEQGFEMGRPSLLTLEIDLRGGAITAVRVGGHAVLVAEAEMIVSEVATMTARHANANATT
jgi:trans-2,3-dihydro-3-hydroxyanthranilate isomerase